MSDDRNNDFDDFQGFDGSKDFGDLNADGMHFSEEELEAAMAGFEQEFKDAEATKNERADNPSSEAFDSSEASDNAESSESSGIDDMLNAAEDSLKFEDELQGLLGNRAKVAVIITRLTSPRLLSAFCELSDISAQCIGSAQGAVAVLRNLDGDGPEAAVKDMTIVLPACLRFLPSTVRTSSKRRCTWKARQAKPSLRRCYSPPPHRSLRISCLASPI